MSVSVSLLPAGGDPTPGKESSGKESSPGAIAGSWPACSLQGPDWADRQRQRQGAIAALNLPEGGSIPAWDEAAQQVAQFLSVPIVVVTVVDGQTEQLRAASGLSSLGVGNPLSQGRQLPLNRGLSGYVVDSGQPLVLSDTTENTAVAHSDWVSTYGIRAYGSVPLVTAQGVCIGTLAAMDRVPRQFSDQDLGFLAMAARWGMSEYERQQPDPAPVISSPASDLGLLSAMARLTLVDQLTQDLRSPLTTVMGMATMLSREIYGPLTQKQREYTDILVRSSQTLIALVDELIDLGVGDGGRPDLVPTSLDIESLGRQVMATLRPLAEKSAQTLTLTVEPGETHWILDQRTVKQLIYHLLFGVMQVAGESSTLRLHACRRGQSLALVLWLSNPWLGEGLPPEIADGLAEPPSQHRDAAPLGLRFSQYLAQRHGGQLLLQGSADSGCRLVALLPTLDGNSRAEAVETRLSETLLEG